jgi:ubiquinone/menaquinone biosynthesis C-methylase UbiE
MDVINAYYKSYMEDERLVKNNSHKVEFLTTSYVLEDLLPPASKLLDIGAGTGKYSFFYSEKGHQVTALEFADANIEILKSKQATLQYENISVQQGDARNLSSFADNSFDVVLCMGPLYHLGAQQDRQQCIGEALRVLRPGGLLALAYINKHASIALHTKGEENFLVSEALMNLIHHGREFNDERDCFFFTEPQEIEVMAEALGARKLFNAATDGIAYLLSEKLNSIDDHQFETWLHYHLSTCKDPALLGHTLHGLYVCRK